MAIYTFGTDYTAIRSSRQGATFSLNQLKGVIRQRVKPLQRLSYRMTLSRNRFTSAMTTWHALTSLEKGGWQGVRSSYYYQYPPFAPYNIPVQSLFAALNKARLNSDLVILKSSSPSVSFPAISLQVIQLSADPFNFLVGVLPAQVYTNFYFRIYATPWRNSIQASVFPADFKLVKVINQNHAALIDITQGYVQRFVEIPAVAATNSLNYYINVVLQLIYVPTGEIKNYPLVTGKEV